MAVQIWRRSRLRLASNRDAPQSLVIYNSNRSIPEGGRTHGRSKKLADDIAIVMESIWREGTSVAMLFHTFGLVSGLRLKPSKCVVIPLWEFLDTRSLKNLIGETIPSWMKFELARKGKYLGVCPGAGGESSWEQPLQKYIARCQYIATLHAGLWTTALLYKTLALSTLSFVVQLSPIPAAALEEERRMLRLLVPGPGNWIPQSALHNLDELLGLPAHFPSLAIWGNAAKARVAITDLADCAAHKRRIAQALLGDDAPLQHQWKNWFHNSVAFTAADSQEQLRRIGMIKPRASTTNTLDQSSLYKIMKKKTRLKDLNELLRDRLSRWQSTEFMNIPIGVAARRAERRVELLKSQVPPSVAAAVGRSWLNGWCTARRFQKGRGS